MLIGTNGILAITTSYPSKVSCPSACPPSPKLVATALLGNFFCNICNYMCHCYAHIENVLNAYIISFKYLCTDECKGITNVATFECLLIL